MAKLYDKLHKYRESLRIKEGKRTPTAVIADGPLENLARAKPTSLDDMLKVAGIGKAFVAKYGEGFLQVIMSDLKPMKLTMMRKEAADTLKNLQARLTNVNRRNRMLYLPRTATGRAIDLSTGDITKVVDTMFAFYGIGMAGEGTPIAVCGSDDPTYAQYNRLIQYASAGIRETGNNNLYVGFPFAVGRLGNGKDKFDVIAPLVLFPVKLENVDGKILMKEDCARSVSYNSALLLLHNKFCGGSFAMPQCELEEVRKRDFIAETLAFYKNCGINIDLDASGKLTKFPTYTASTFPVKAADKYVLVRSAVVGLFPMYSGAMQKDFDDIIERGLMPPTLAELLKDADEIDDFYGDSTDDTDDGQLDADGNIDHISELNVSQERAVEQAASQTTLVMQGPPGTGKSQTITSMVSNEVCNGRNVLIVSQKRAALSVIYSRLGALSRYALFIDDPKDKDAFYGKLKYMLDSADKPAAFNNVAYDRTVAAIGEDTAALDGIAAALLGDMYGAPLIDIYRENIGNPFKIAESSVSGDKPESAVFAECVPSALLDRGYDELKASRAYLDDETLMATLDEFYDLGERYDWLIDVKKNISGSEISEMIAALDKLLDMYAYDRSLRGKLKFRKRLKEFVKEKFVAYDRKLYKRFVKDPVGLFNGMKAYTTFYESKLTADTLDFGTRLYFGTLKNLQKATGKSTRELCGRLFEYCGYSFIDRFENEHRDIVSRIKGFPTIVSRICASIDKKRSLTRDKMQNLLKNAFNTNIAESKRRSDMLRAIDGKRRPAISKFIEKFEFELFRGVRVFLMTPEAVSELLPLKNDLFDLLVFDEASQIYVERGIPAIARARRLVVCGDRKQLRPSSLGDGRISVDDDDDSAIEEESLLDIARFTFPEIMLGYHYRSRYEELIAFSNAAFYDGRLNISPNPTKPETPPITVHKVNGVWDERINPVEARKTVELISAHLAYNESLPESERETLGVITFNATQRDHILDLLDEKCDADPTFRRMYRNECARTIDGEDVGLFVKNIENVQGDERDAIIFSFAYARNKKGVVSRNFGWLNRQGGENRLNVAISRAKKRIDIVTSIIPIDLKTDDVKSEGVKILRKYLEYAYYVSDGDTDGAMRVLDSFKSDNAHVTDARSGGLADVLCAALQERGIDVERNVGMGNYKLDLAIKNSRGEYALGVECDDSVLQANASTRERDVMRGKFLRSRGWTLVRVWSSDWYDDPDKVVKDLLAKAGGLM